MKKPIEKRLNIALYAREWEILQQYMKEHDVDQTQAIRNLIRDWEEKRREAAVWVENTARYLNRSEKEDGNQ